MTPAIDQAVSNPFMNTREAAEYLGQTERWVRRQIEEGKLKRTKMNRTVRFRKSDLDAYIAENTGTSQPGQ